MSRIAVKFVGGPQNGFYASTGDDVKVITGLSGMRAPSVDNGDGTYSDDEGNTVDSYILDDTTIRDFTGEEKGAFDFMFVDHDVTRYCEFTYSDGSSS